MLHSGPHSGPQNGPPQTYSTTYERTIWTNMEQVYEWETKEPSHGQNKS